MKESTTLPLQIAWLMWSYWTQLRTIPLKRKEFESQGREMVVLGSASDCIERIIRQTWNDIKILQRYHDHIQGWRQKVYLCFIKNTFHIIHKNTSSCSFLVRSSPSAIIQTFQQIKHLIHGQGGKTIFTSAKRWNQGSSSSEFLAQGIKIKWDSGW